jgi:hypothetical protein
MMNLATKFLSKIVKDANDNGCWYLKSDDGSSFKDVFYFKRKGYKAKRFSYIHFKGKIKTGLKVLCKCSDKLCINPDHHFLGTGSDQIKLIMSRGWKHKKGWKQKPEVIKIISKTHKEKVISQEMREHLRKMNIGKKHSLITRMKMSRNRIGIPVQEEARKKIAATKQGEKNYNTRLDVETVRKIRNLEGKMKITEVAERFSISYVHVVNIWRKKVWKHV